MKKFFKKTLLLLGFCTLGLGTTSCNSETLANLLPVLAEIINNVFKGGTTNAYQGDYTLQHLYSDGKGGFLNDGEVQLYPGTTCTATLNSDNTINILLPHPDSVGKAAMTDVTIYKLEFTKDNTGAVTNTVDLGKNSSIDGKITVDGQEYAASNLYIECTLTDGVLYIKTASIYFGADASQVINVTFKGNIVKAAR